RSTVGTLVATADTHGVIDAPVDQALVGPDLPGGIEVRVTGSQLQVQLVDARQAANHGNQHFAVQLLHVDLALGAAGGEEADRVVGRRASQLVIGAPTVAVFAIRSTESRSHHAGRQFEEITR